MTEHFRLSGMTRHLLPAFEFEPTGDEDDDIPPCGGKPVTRRDLAEYVHRDNIRSSFRKICFETRPHTTHGRPCTYEHVPLPYGYQPGEAPQSRPRPWLNEEFQQHLEDLNGLLMDHCKGVQDYANQLWGVYEGMLNGHPTHAILEATLKTQFLNGLDERFTDWRVAYLQEKQIVPRSSFDMHTTEWNEVVLDAIAEETRLDRLEARAVREAEAAAEEEERQRAKVNEDTICRTIRTFEDLPVSSIAESSHLSVAGTEEGGVRGPVLQDVKQNIAPKLPRLEAWLDGAELSDVGDIPDEEEEEFDEEEIEEVPVAMPEVPGFVVEETPSPSVSSEEESEEGTIVPPASVLGRRRRGGSPLPPMPTGDHITVLWRNGVGVRPRVAMEARARATPRPRTVQQVPVVVIPRVRPFVSRSFESGVFEIPETDQEDNATDEDDDDDDDEEEENEDEDEGDNEQANNEVEAENADNEASDDDEETRANKRARYAGTPEL